MVRAYNFLMKRFFFALLLLPALVQSAPLFAVAPPYGEMRRDRSAEFVERIGALPNLNALNASPLAQKLADYEIIFVPGFLGDYVESLSGYYEEQMSYLQARM